MRKREREKMLGKASTSSEATTIVPASPTDGAVYNILFLGETGAGKSTVINALSNYLGFGSFDAALHSVPNGPTVLISGEFEMLNENYESTTIEYTSTAAVQSYKVLGITCTNHVFKYNNSKFKIIDTSGVDKYRKKRNKQHNLLELLREFSKLETEIQEIVLVLKISEEPISSHFINFTKPYLERNSKEDGVSVIFTHCHTTVYHSKGVSIIKGNLMGQLFDLSSSIKMYGLDNVPFLFLMAKQNEFKVCENDIGKCREIWIDSAKEIQHLLENVTAKNLQPKGMMSPSGGEDISSKDETESKKSEESVEMKIVVEEDVASSLYIPGSKKKDSPKYGSEQKLYSDKLRSRFVKCVNIDGTPNSGRIYLSRDFKKRVFLKDCVHLSEKVLSEGSFFPSDETLSLLTLAVCKDNPDVLPDGWTLLTKASNDDDGSFGAALWNVEHQQLVFAHRGTFPLEIKSVLGDVKAIKELFVPQMNSAATFVAHLLKELPGTERMQISITGHSLGAWLAQITAFTVEYLIIKDRKFCLKEEVDFMYHAHTVGFESPGCKSSLTKLAENLLFETSPEILVQKLDITNYLTFPNPINSCDEHVGDLRMIIIKKADNEFLNFAEYIEYYHNMENIVDALSKEELVDYEAKIEESSRFKILRLPNLKNVSQIIEHRLKGPIRFMNHLYERAALPMSEPNSNVTTSELHSDGTIMLFSLRNDGFELKLECQVGKVNELVFKSNIFTEPEFAFLSRWLTLTEKQKSQFPNHFKLKLAPYFGMKSFTKLLRTFCSIDESQQLVECESKSEKNKVINVIKHLFRSLSYFEAKQLNQQLVEYEQRVSFKACQVESEKYIKKISKSQLEFEASMDLIMFLESKDENILVLKCVERNILEMSRIFSLVKRMKIENVMFLNWKQIINLKKIYQSKLSHHLIVLDCQNCSERTSEKDSLKWLIENLKNKLILVVDSKSEIFELIKMRSIIVNSSLKFSNLKKKSQLLLNEKRIILNDQEFTLNDLLDEKGKEMLSLKTIALLSENNVNIGKFNLDSTNFNDVSIQLFETIDHHSFVNSLNDKMNCIIMISGERKEFLKMFNEEQKKTIELFEQKYKIKMCTEIEEQTMLNNLICQSAADGISIFLLKIDFKKLVLQQIFNPNLYAPIKLHKNTKLKNDIFEFLAKDETTDIFMFNNLIDEPFKANESGLTRDNFSTYFDIDSILSQQVKSQFLQKFKTSIFCFQPHEVEIKFNELGNVHNNKTVHWLNLGGKSEVRWHKSRGSIQSLTPYLDESALGSAFSPADLIDERFVVICDEPGMGKSTFLAKLGIEFTKPSGGWVINLHLPSHQPDLENALPLNNLGDVIELVVQTSDLEPKDLLAQILLRSLNSSGFNKKIFFLFDGFDELNLAARENMLRILTILKEESLAKICITTGPEQKHVLEDCLSVFSSKLTRFDLKEYLIKFCTSCLHFHQYENSLLRNCVNEMIDGLEKVLREEMSKYLETTLHVRMLVETVWPLIEGQITSHRESLEFIENFNEYNLITEFINHKFVVYLKRQNLLQGNKLVKSLESVQLAIDFREFALITLFPIEARDIFQVKLEINDNMKRKVVRVGLVQEINRTFQFIHRIITEYFVADFLADWMIKHTQHEKYELARKFVTSEILLQEKHKNIKKFFNFETFI